MFRTSHVFDIHHSFFRLDGFAGNGHEALVGETFPTTMSQAVPFKDANQSVIEATAGRQGAAAEPGSPRLGSAVVLLGGWRSDGLRRWVGWPL
jgi:hypothetical protein